MRKLPKKFIIFGQEVLVEFADLPENVDGYSLEEGRIQISTDAKASKIKQILIHEFLHSVVYRTSLDGVISLEVEEMIVEHFSKALCENFDIRPKKL